MGTFEEDQRQHLAYLNLVKAQEMAESGFKEVQTEIPLAPSPWPAPKNTDRHLILPILESCIIMNDEYPQEVDDTIRMFNLALNHPEIMELRHVWRWLHSLTPDYFLSKASESSYWERILLRYILSHKGQPSHYNIKIYRKPIFGRDIEKAYLLALNLNMAISISKNDHQRSFADYYRDELHNLIERKKFVDDDTYFVSFKSNEKSFFLRAYCVAGKSETIIRLPIVILHGEDKVSVCHPGNYNYEVETRADLTDKEDDDSSGSDIAENDSDEEQEEIEGNEGKKRSVIELGNEEDNPNIQKRRVLISED
jgi:hypothetical protein